MARIIKKITVDVSKPNFFTAIIAKQYDSKSRFLEATLVHDNEQVVVEPTATVTINAKRKDGVAKPFAGEVNEDGTVVVPLTYWMLELYGTVDCDISIIDTDGEKLTSTKFVLDVERASCSNEDIESDEDFDILSKLIDEAKNGVTDKNYNAESENAQSGIAVAQAIDGLRTELQGGIDEVSELVGGAE
jgi:hypothetical protein